MFTQARLFRIIPYANVVFAMLAAVVLGLAANTGNPWLALCGVALMTGCLYVASKIGARLALTSDQ